MSTPIVGSEPNIGVIIRERDPLSLEYPFDQLDEFLTAERPFLHPESTSRLRCWIVTATSSQSTEL